ncbi:MAG: translation initiation factor [Sulfurovaceae bacterium]|jgi:translation initiation factor 1|nr:translation initiation factor [Sulfurovaceae bacterium]
MKKNLFEMGASWDNCWSSDNKTKEADAPKETKTPQQHKLHFAREKRNGKTVTIVKPFFLDESTAEALLKTLKKSLATGGTAKENTLEFQGEVTEKLKAQLIKLGYGMKK